MAHPRTAAEARIPSSFRYGIDIMKGMGLDLRVIRACNANMFLSPVFRQTLANVANATIELYDTDGAQGAARGAGLGAGIFVTPGAAFGSLQRMGEVTPQKAEAGATAAAYAAWLSHLQDAVRQAVRARQGRMHMIFSTLSFPGPWRIQLRLLRSIRLPYHPSHCPRENASRP